MRKPLSRSEILSRRIRRILVIDEGSPGHLTQSRGLARALAEHCQAEVEVYKVRLALRGIFRPWLRMACAMARRGLPDWLLRLAYRFPDKTPPAAELIVTSGGRGFCYAVSLARRSGAKLVFCGDPAPLPAAWCDVILSPLPLAGHDRVIETAMLLTEVSATAIAGQGADFRHRFAQSGGSRLAALLIGGDSRSHRYAVADWQALIDGANQLGARGWRWLVTTSRRTPVAVEKLLQQGLRPEYLISTVWWQQGPEPVVRGFLDAADIVLVTRDSLSMLSEAIAAGKPALALVPHQVLASPFIDAILATQLRDKRLRQLAMTELGNAQFEPDDYSLLQASPLPDYADRVVGLLGLAEQPAG